MAKKPAWRKSEYKKWACGVASASIKSAVERVPELFDSVPDRIKAIEALAELRTELIRRADDVGRFGRPMRSIARRRI